MDSEKDIPKPEGEGWERSGRHWEREVESEPCAYCGCTTLTETTYSWPYCSDCKAV
jgi:hypothetical protein